MQCQALLKFVCPEGHSQSWKCHLNLTAAPSCKKCAKKRKDAELLALKLHEEQKRIEAANVEHQFQMDKLRGEIEILQKQMQDERHQAEKNAAIDILKADLAALHLRAASMGKHPPSVPTAQNQTPKNTKTVPSAVPNPSLDHKHQQHTTETKSPPSRPALATSPSKSKWERQKTLEGAVNPAIDEIMEMIGLEAVKEKILGIKAKVELTQRQLASLKKERFSLVLLGNPGTGMSGMLLVPAYIFICSML